MRHSAFHVIMLSISYAEGRIFIGMLNVINPSVVMLNVAAPLKALFSK